MPSPACDQCFRRKHPCLGGRPSCEQCLRTGLTCTYSTGKPVGKPKGHKKRRMGGSTSSAGSSTSTPFSPVPVRLQPHQSLLMDDSRESSVAASSVPDGEFPAAKRQKRSTSPDTIAIRPTSNATMPTSLSPMVVNTIPQPYAPPAEYPWNTPSSSSSGPHDRVLNIGTTSSFEHSLQQPMLTTDAWMPHADLLEWQALLNQTNNHTTVVDGAQLFTEPSLMTPNEYGVIPYISPVTTNSQHSPTSTGLGTIVYRSCEFKENQGTDDQHLEAIRDTVNCVSSALQWPSCTDTNCLDVCLMDCILALQQCVECLSAVVSGGQHRQHSIIEAEGRLIESPQLQMQLVYTLAHSRLEDVDRLTGKIRQLVEMRREQQQGGYLAPLLGVLKDAVNGLNEKLFSLLGSAC